MNSCCPCRFAIYPGKENELDLQRRDTDQRERQKDLAGQHQKARELFNADRRQAALPPDEESAAAVRLNTEDNPKIAGKVHLF